MSHTPDDLTGQALWHATGRVAQGVGATPAGSVSQLASPAAVLTLLAFASLAVTPTPATAARRERTAPLPVPSAP